MKKLIAWSLLFWVFIASAQDLHTFSNGEVADAEKINENFNALKAQMEAISHTGSEPLTGWGWFDNSGAFVGYGLPRNNPVYSKLASSDYVYEFYEIWSSQLRIYTGNLYFESTDCSGPPLLDQSQVNLTTSSSAPFGTDLEGFIHVLGEPLPGSIESRSRTTRGPSTDKVEMECKEDRVTLSYPTTTIPTGEQHVTNFELPIRLKWISSAIGLPQGIRGEIIEAFNTGAIVVKDANGTLLGEYYNGYSNTWEMVIDRPSTDDVGVRIAIDNDAKRLFGEVSSDIFFEDANCEGASFSEQSVPAGGLNGSLYLGEQLDGSDWAKWFVFTDQKFTSKLVQSRLLRKECHELSSYVMQNAVLVMPYILPAELLQMAFPLSLEQLP